jgi:hypothetical protein
MMDLALLTSEAAWFLFDAPARSRGEAAPAHALQPLPSSRTRRGQLFGGVT